VRIHTTDDTALILRMLALQDAGGVPFSQVVAVVCAVILMYAITVALVLGLLGRI